jgi:phosphinothricin acetyltransferase
MSDAHAAAVLSIYQAGIDEGNATFETRTPSWGEFLSSRPAGYRFVALDPLAPDVLGWVAATPVSDRCAYAGVVEHSVYVAPSARGRGVGRALLAQLIAATEAAGIWTIQSEVFPNNAANLALHQRAGFRQVGRRERIGPAPRAVAGRAAARAAEPRHRVIRWSSAAVVRGVRCGGVNGHLSTDRVRPGGTGRTTARRPGGPALVRRPQLQQSASWTSKPREK